MFEDFDVGSDWSQMFDGSGVNSTPDLGGALSSLYDTGSDFSGLFDGSGLEGGSDAGGALSQVLGGEGSPNVGGVSDPEALKLLGGSGEAPAPGKNLASQIGGLFQDKSGNLDLAKILKVGLGVSGFVNSMANRTKQQRNQQSQALQQQLQQAKGQWTPQQAAWSNNFFQTPASNPGVQYASEMRSPITPGRGYAGGGEVFDAATGAPVEEPEQLGALGLVAGEGGGQDDLVEARLSPGEYVLDADTVSLIGDGSNEAGAQRLDMWREALREHKRAAPADEIPPPAKDPMAYLPQGDE